MDLKQHKHQSIELFNNTELFSNERIEPKDFPYGLYAYDMRDSADDPLGISITTLGCGVMPEA